jgi:23S rRNA-/tRNA-specific pseudouridylate synthase
VYGGNGEVLWQSGKFALHREFMHIREVAAGCLELINRQALHAATLALTHPLTGQRMKFESALPCDFVQLIEYLQLKRIICGVY